MKLVMGLSSHWMIWCWFVDSPIRYFCWNKKREANDILMTKSTVCKKKVPGRVFFLLKIQSLLSIFSVCRNLTNKICICISKYVNSLFYSIDTRWITKLMFLSFVIFHLFFMHVTKVLMTKIVSAEVLICPVFCCFNS